MIPYQDNRNHSFKTTKDILTNAGLLLVANRDKMGYSQGKVFLDHGESLSELETKQYEYYSLQLSGNTLSKQVLN